MHAEMEVQAYRSDVEVLTVAGHRAPRIVTDEALDDVLFVSTLLVQLLHQLLKLLLRRDGVNTRHGSS